MDKDHNKALAKELLLFKNGFIMGAVDSFDIWRFLSEVIENFQT